MDILRNKIELQARSTIGYSEAVDKESFMTGVNVCFTLTKQHYESEIQALKNLADTYLRFYEDSRKDLTTLSDIINKYASEK